MTDIDIKKYSKRFQEALKSITPPDSQNVKGKLLYGLIFRYITLLNEAKNLYDDSRIQQISSIEHKVYRIIKNMSGKEMVENNSYIETFFSIQDYYIETRHRLKH